MACCRGCLSLSELTVTIFCRARVFLRHMAGLHGRLDTAMKSVLHIFKKTVRCSGKYLVFFQTMSRWASIFGFNGRKHRRLPSEVFTSLSRHRAYPSPSSTIREALYTRL